MTPPDRQHPTDVEVLSTAISLIPDLEVVATAARLVRDRGLRFPLDDHDALAALFDNGPVTVDGRRFEHKQVTRYLPTEFFPISSYRDLMQKLLLALQRGRTHHELEAAQAAAQESRPQGPHTHLPSPVPFPANYASYALHHEEQ